MGVLATTYGVFSLGIQLNVGTTGIVNFGQAGFMAVGAYAMGILVVKSGVSFWLAMVLGVGVAIGAALLVGLPSLRLRSDYFAIATLAFSEIVRYTADNWEDLTGGNLGLFGYTNDWTTTSARIDGWLADIGVEQTFLLPLLLVNVAVFLLLDAGGGADRAVAVGPRPQRDPRGRGRCPGARARTRLPTSCSRSRSAASLAAVAGYMLAINISILSPTTFDPVLTAYGYVIVILGGLGSYRGVVVGSLLFIFVLEATRYLDLPLSDARVAALRFMIVGARPDGARRPAPAGALRQAGGAGAACPLTPSPGLLSVRSVTKRFGGLAAVNAPASTSRPAP